MEFVTAISKTKLSYLEENFAHQLAAKHSYNDDNHNKDSRSTI